MSENKQKLLDYLRSKDVMVLATSRERPTACTVCFGIDDDFNFYIVTSPTSEHGKNIIANQQVACVITDTSQSMLTQHKIGAQIIGTAEEIKDSSEMKKALLVWSKDNEDLAEKFKKNISENIWKDGVFIIKPTEIKWFNEELYGSEGTEIFRF